LDCEHGYTTVDLHQGRTNAVVYFLRVEGVDGVEIHRCLSAQYGDMLPQWRVCEWSEMFKNSWTSVTIAEGSGCPSTSTSDVRQARAMILSDRKQQ
jgi:hypothetical protein